mmetsp:Transcript_78539/g.182238  ORF Transcript_78539/g.182238 Transcript_78539/m.182238 type:complete len:204 (+) Transcript_78539:544-1155(+)
MHCITSVFASGSVKTSSSAKLPASSPPPAAASPLAANTSVFIWYTICKSLTIELCTIMSVWRMVSMQHLRTSLNCSLESFWKTFVAGFDTIVYSLAQCMFSSGERSLYCSASSWRTSDKKPLFTPGCPRSCATAAMSRECCSSSDRNRSEDVRFMMRATQWTTSNACAKLWKGTDKYSFSTAPTKRCNNCTASGVPKKPSLES